MRNHQRIPVRYGDWYSEELFESYLKGMIELDDVLEGLDYDRIQSQTELYNFLNLLLTNKFPHYCYNHNCEKKLYFSNTYYYAKESEKLSLKEFVRIWITPHNLYKYKNWKIYIPFFCCDCYKKRCLFKK
ncbi:MAG: hypothetical protein ACFE8J_12770 [Candidatus Heimdallarchaeota archaeon]